MKSVLNSLFCIWNTWSTKHFFGIADFFIISINILNLKDFKRWENSKFLSDLIFTASLTVSVTLFSMKILPFSTSGSNRPKPSYPSRQRWKKFFVLEFKKKRKRKFGNKKLMFKSLVLQLNWFVKGFFHNCLFRNNFQFLMYLARKNLMKA